jgi:type IV pilus assembly protein PilB
MTNPSVSSASNKKRFGELLVEAGLLKEEDVPRVLQEQRTKRGERFGETVVRLGLASEVEIARALSDQLGIPFIDLTAMSISQAALQEVPERLAKKHQILPVAVLQKELHLAMADPLKFEALQDVRFTSNCTIVPLLATVTDIKKGIQHHYSREKGDTIDDLVKDMAGDLPIELMQDHAEFEGKEADDRRRSESAPIVRVVNLIVSQAVETGASDIHIEPGKSNLLIRNRVDGLLRQSLEAPKWVQGPVISRIKVMSRMDIAEKRLPQDGRVAIKVGQKMYDLRVSTVPGSHGEKVVIRVLDSSKVTASLESMGLEPSEFQQMQALITRPQGIVLVTGPTGAGKTSTLYGMLNSLHSVERNITTIEDPIEYELAGINQTAVQEKIGLTFGAMLRALLRQDPDVIMLGEMRDAETTNIALQASITGHLVLSTMHTGNAVATVTRLRNIGVPSYVIASAVNGILAQRLVRSICQHCRKPSAPTEADVARLGSLTNMAKLESFVGSGCVMCNGSGYKGRTAVFEILTFSPAIRALVSADASELEIRREALAEGMHTLLTAALAKVRAGKTTLSELFRVIELDEVDQGSADECPSCGSVTEPEFVACPVCACRLAPACPSCDRKVLEHWKACPYCCTRLDGPAPKAGRAEMTVVASDGRTKAVRKPGPALAAAN